MSGSESEQFCLKWNDFQAWLAHNNNNNNNLLPGEEEQWTWYNHIMLYVHVVKIGKCSNLGWSSECCINKRRRIIYTTYTHPPPPHKIREIITLGVTLKKLVYLFPILVNCVHKYCWLIESTLSRIFLFLIKALVSDPLKTSADSKTPMCPKPKPLIFLPVS